MSAYLLQIAREKSCDYVLIIYMREYEIIYHNCGEAKRASSEENNLFKPCVRSKQPRTIKTIIYNDIFTSLEYKKFRDRLNNSRTCSVCVRITFDEMESSFAMFNHICF